MPETFTKWIFVSDPKLKAKHQKLRVKNLTDPSNMEGEATQRGPSGTFQLERLGGPAARKA